MPRQDVPYGGAICRLKERIAEIWDELGKKLHSINGVEGDGQGDVKLVSGDPAVVITDDQLQHEIEISLDTSQLPAAAVSSVNGQTGAVALDAGDIPSDGNSDVQTDIDVNKAAISACSSAITSEQLARQNADSTLQGNINTLSASIPTAAATAVANDPTVAQLATDVPNKVDKITSGSSLKAYTHTGATQGETSVVDGTTANSIGIRDANGRMQAADPASGATDKTLVTANWVSQTGANRPNNLIHGNGNEEIGGDNIFPGYNAIVRASPVFACKSNTLEIGAIPTSGISYGMQFTDKNNSSCGGITEYHGTNGISQTLINLRNPSNNIAVTLHLQINTDGSVSLYMDATGGRSVSIATLPAYP